MRSNDFCLSGTSTNQISHFFLFSPEPKRLFVGLGHLGETYSQVMLLKTNSSSEPAPWGEAAENSIGHAKTV